MGWATKIFWSRMQISYNKNFLFKINLPGYLTTLCNFLQSLELNLTIDYKIRGRWWKVLLKTDDG